MSGRAAPPKPWEVRGGSNGATTSGAADSLPKPWERSPQDNTTTTVTPASQANTLLPGSGTSTQPGSQQAPRPWERTTNANTGPISSYGGYNTNTYGSGMYNRAGTYGSAPGGYGSSSYGTGMYGSGGMYGGGYGASTYGGGYGTGSMYGGGYGGMYGRPMGAYGGGMMGGMMGGPMMGGPPWDPNDPNGPPAPPSAWQAMLHTISGVVHFFGRLSFLVDENAHAVHFFITALLQLLDRFGSLYGELARFVLRLLGFRPKEKVAAGAIVPGGAARKPGRAPGLSSTQPGGGGGSPWDSVWSRKDS